MIKSFLPTDWPTTQEPTLWVKVASSGWGGNDKWGFRKTAGERISELVKEAMSKRLPGEELLIVNAMGATEIEGPNRNGDGFRLATLEKYHPTFKSAKWYRDHQTDDPKISYGVIKAATFDPHTGRVPVAVALNGTKEAAERNNGRVANLELDDIQSERAIKVSMSCKVSGDICSSCGNRAKRREDYCKAATCKHGGCAENLGRVSQDGHVLHTDNPDPNFFDLSRISTNQAGRTAFVYGRVKSASEHRLDMQVGHSWVAPLVKRLAEEETAMSKRGGIYVPKFVGVTGISPDHTSVSALVERSGILSGENWESAFGVTLPNLFGIYTKLASHPQLLDRVPTIAYQVPTKESKDWALRQSIIPYVSGQQVKSAALAFLDGSRRAATERAPNMTEEGLEYVAYQLASLHRNENEANAARTIIRNNFDLAG